MRTLSTIVLLALVLVPGRLVATGTSEDEANASQTQTQVASVPPSIAENWTETGGDAAWTVEVRDGDFVLVDGLGTAVPMTDYEKVVITSAGAVEILYELGAEERIAAIGTSRSGIWPEEQTAQLPSVGGLSRPSFEQIVAFEPDLVIANGMNTEIATDLNELGIATIIHSTETIAEILNAVLILGVLTGTTDRANAIVAERRETLATVRSALAEQPLDLKGAFVYSVDPIMGFREDSLPGEILSILGVRNIAAGLTTEQPILSAEYILEQDPDFLLGAMSIRTPDQILNADSAVMQTRAGRENNIFIVPSQWLLRPTPRVIDALELLHEELSAYDRPAG
ncbi:MAG: ABC transporter substrate-binding protein [Spirochaetota bacterium]